MDAFILALENVNRLSGGYRAESFVFLIVNAWELLLKARIIDTDPKGRSAIFVKAKEDGKKGAGTWSIGIDACINKLFRNENDPVRRNLEQVILDRNKSTHLVLPRITNEQLGLYQACVLNFHKMLQDWFGMSIHQKTHVAMMTIVFSSDPEQYDLTNKVMKRTLGAEGVRYLANRQAEILKIQAEAGYGTEFMAEIRHNIHVMNRPGQAEVSMTAGVGGSGVVFKDRYGDPAVRYPFRQKEVVIEVKKALPGEVPFTQHDVQCIRKRHRIDENPEYFFLSKAIDSTPRYSPMFVGWIVSTSAKNPLWLQECRDYVTKMRRAASAVVRPQAQSSVEN